MKKIISLFIILSIIFITVSAAPYRNEFLNREFFSMNFINFLFNGKKFDVPDEQVQEKEEKPVRTMESVTASVCIANSVSKALVNGEDAVKVTFYTGGKDTLYECYFTDSSRTKGGLYTYKDISAGSIFYVSVDDESFVTNYSVISVISKITKLPATDSSAMTYNLVSPKAECRSSYIKDYRRKDDRIIVEFVNGEVHSVNDDAFSYTFDNNGRTLVIDTDTFLAGDVDKAMYDDTTGTTIAYPVVAFLWNGEVVAICSFGTPVALNGNFE